jgi:hypothetical protein
VQMVKGGVADGEQAQRWELLGCMLLQVPSCGHGTVAERRCCEDGTPALVHCNSCPIHRIPLPPPPTPTHTWLRPTLEQMEVALVDQAVEKLRRGPTSTTTWLGAAVSSTLAGVRRSGSKVSRSSLGQAAAG